MEQSIIKLIMNFGYGIIGFAFLYQILKWLLGKLTNNLDAHTDSLKELLENHKQLSEDHKDIMGKLKKD